MIPQGTIVKLKKGYIGRIYWGVVIDNTDKGAVCVWKRTREEAMKEYKKVISGHTYNEGDLSDIAEEYIEIKQPITKLISWREMLK